MVPLGDKSFQWLAYGNKGAVHYCCVAWAFWPLPWQEACLVAGKVDSPNSWLSFCDDITRWWFLGWCKAGNLYSTLLTAAFTTSSLVFPACPGCLFPASLVTKNKDAFVMFWFCLWQMVFWGSWFLYQSWIYERKKTEWNRGKEVPIHLIYLSSRDEAPYISCAFSGPLSTKY